MALVPHNQNWRQHIVDIAGELGLGAWTANQVIQAIQNGQDLYETLQPYLPNTESINRAIERFTTPDPGYIQLINQQAREGTLGQPAGLARLASETNDAMQMRQRANNQLGMQAEDRLGNIQRELGASQQVFNGKLISQFTLNYTDV